jgi:hypothetical protein
MRNVSDKSCRINQSTHFMFKNSFSKNCVGNKMTWKNTCRAGQATDEIMVHVHCNAGYLRLQTLGFGIFNNKKISDTCIGALMI